MTASAVVPTVDLAIDGMTCAACVSRVEKALASVPGVSRAEVNLATRTARIQGAGLTPGVLVEAVEDIGYGATALQTPGDATAAGARSAARAQKAQRHAILALALCLPFFAGMLGMAVGQDWVPPAWIQFAIAALVQFWLGARFYTGAWKALRAGSATMDLLVALGTSAAFGLSLYLWWASAGHHGHGTPHLYFESSAVVVAFVLLGKWLEERATAETATALRALGQLRPTQARVIEDGREAEVPIEAVRVGDLVAVRAGERIPVDGVVRDGSASVDESMVTGESLPVTRGPGSHVTGGTVDLDGRLVVETTAIGAETTLAKVIRLVEGAQASKAPVQKLVDRVSAVFVPIVIVVAALTLAAWLIAGGGWERALVCAVSVLVIACPCALGLATPTAILAGTGVAARHGILVRDAAAMERAAQVTAVVFDKTGTLTTGEPVVTAVRAAPGETEAGVLRLAAALESGSEHPLARAIRNQAPDAPAAVEFRSIVGGVEASVEGRRLVLGNAACIDALGVDRTALRNDAERLSAEGRGVSYLAALDPPRLLGLVAFSDEPKPQSKAAVAALRAEGVRTLMLTGDGHGAADRVARLTGIDDVVAEVKPADKAQEVERLKASGAVVAMVGDGINDAPALAAADVGIAMGGGTDVAIETAGLTLMRGDPRLVPAALSLSRSVAATIRRGLFWAFAYNVVGIPLAALGILSPVLAGAAMALSSVSVVLNALLLRRWRPALRD